jgi:uncharacterized protein (DUF983 family)
MLIVTPADPLIAPDVERVASRGPRTIPTGLLRGARRQCPNCGRGSLFKGYLAVQPVCAVCGNDNGRYPADDGPAYFTILLIGHLVVAPMLALSVIKSWSPWSMLAVAMPIVIGATLAALPFIKGAWIGVLWATTDPKEPVVEPA